MLNTKEQKVDLYHKKTNQLHFEIIFAEVIKARNIKGHSIYLTNELEYELFKKDPLAYCNAVFKKEKPSIFYELDLFHARLLHRIKPNYIKLLKLKGY
ncbi:hypothetical protein [Tenacibaculum soleae]|uniref:hypothetical protein n=1 Tax=Tenacibaculum soleae TaxID=447689 RepID=UPI0026E3120B|nr:hypothetical protein [Tenacibaculum soleae]MDO6813245.1 hypothetical protein [Tenacibaculum soleae]